MARGSAGESVLAKHLRVLDAFDVHRPYLTLAEVAELAGVAPSTAHRLVGELVREGLLERQDDRTYRLGLRLWELAARTPGALGLREVARPWLAAVHAQVRQHAQLGVRVDADVLFVERMSARDAVVNATLIGGRIPLALSSSGLVLLAHAEPAVLERVVAAGWPRVTAGTIPDAAELRRRVERARADGFAELAGAIHPESRGIAVPVPGRHGEGVYAALGVVVANDGSPIGGVVELLTAAAAGIARALDAAYRPEGALLSTSPRSLEFLLSPEAVRL